LLIFLSGTPVVR